MVTSLQPLFTEALQHLLYPIREILADERVSEVMINGPSEIYLERGGLLELTTCKFENEAALSAAARGIAQFSGKRLTVDVPSVEARLPDGSRVHIVQAPAARNGLCMSIRRFSRKRLLLTDLVASGSITEEAGDLLRAAVTLKKNVIVSGGTGSGKTTLLNCLSGLIGGAERIIVIEDTTELQLQQEHVVQLEAQVADRFGKGGISIRELFKASLRMRPDRIVVGECRGGEALDMIQAMTSGHSGSMSTLHADTPLDALSRLETMALMSGIELPLLALRAQVASAVDIIVQVARLSDGSRRVLEIAEVSGLDDVNRFRIHRLFELRQTDTHRSFEWTGERPKFANAVLTDRALFSSLKNSRRIWAAQADTLSTKTGDQK